MAEEFQITFHTLEFSVYRCNKTVCPIILFEDYDKSRCCPLCGVLGQGIS